jgi:hypothetical protein
MKLRNGHLAIVDRRKVVAYLLNPAHPRNGGKARFFKALGFSATHADQLIDGLRRVAATGETSGSSQSAHGEKSVVDGLLWLHTERGPASMVRTVLILEPGQQVRRLVTAYPKKR